MSETKPSRILVLGAGAVVNQCFLPAVQALGLMETVTVLDARPVSSEVKAQYPSVDFQSADYRQFLLEADLQAFYVAIIALPNAFHEDAVTMALKRRLHVLCEKPLTLSSDSCLRLGTAAAAAGRILAVNMVRRLYPSVNLARYAIDRGLIGRMEALDIEHGSSYAWPAQSLAPFRKENGGVLADMGVHYLDLAEFLAGEMSPRAYEDDCQGGVEADLVYQLESHSGVEVRIALSRLRTLRNMVSITGSEGRIEFAADVVDRCKLTTKDGRTIELSAEHPFSAGDFAPSFEACFIQQVHEFLECGRTGIAPAVDAAMAARTVAHIEWAYGRRKPRSVTIAPRSTERLEGILQPAPALVTGGTGFIGSHLIEGLFERGFSDVIAAVRSPRTCARIARFPVRLENVDLLDAGAVRQAVRGVRQVFHLAYGRDGTARGELTIKGTQHIVNAAIEEGCESVVILSTAYVFGKPSGTVTEEHPYRPAGGEYGESKAEMERWCLKRALTSGSTRLVILNPSCVYGPWGDTFSELPVRLAREQAFCWIDGGKGSANYTFAGNLIHAIMLAAQNPDAHGHRFIINDGTTTWREFLGPIVEPWQPHVPSYTKAELTGMERETRHGVWEAMHRLSASPDVRDIVRNTSVGARTISMARRYFPKGTGQALKNGVARSDRETVSRPRPPAWLADLFENSANVYSSEKAQRILGWRPEIDLPEGQRRTLEHLQYLYSPCDSPFHVAVPS